MAINETLSGTATSASTSPSGATSDVIIEAAPAGKVYLQVQAPGSSVWVNVTSQRGSYVIATPDSGLSYRFSAKGLTQDTLVYFGA